MNIMPKISKGDRRAIIALAVIATFYAGVLFITDSQQPDNSTATTETQKDGNTPSSPTAVSHSLFDPNTVDSATLVAHGIKPWKVKNFIHYRNAGARFSTPQSILRTYGWEDNDLQTLMPYIRIGKEYASKPDKHTAHHTYAERPPHRKWADKESTADTTHKRHYYHGKFKSLTLLDVNTVDTSTLCSVPGIGSVIARSIVRYRDRLGGYTSVSQLSEISIVSPELLEWFKMTDTPNIRTLNINKASFQQLNSHPYITYDQTRDIVNYRKIYGNIADIKHLISTNIFTQEEIERIKPYIDF